MPILNKNAQIKIKIKIPFFRKKFSKKPISRHNMQSNTLTKREYKGKIYLPSEIIYRTKNKMNIKERAGIINNKYVQSVPLTII